MYNDGVNPRIVGGLLKLQTLLGLIALKVGIPNPLLTSVRIPVAAVHLGKKVGVRFLRLGRERHIKDDPLRPIPSLQQFLLFGSLCTGG